MKQKLIFNNKHKSRPLNFRPENPFIKFIELRVISEENDMPEKFESKLIKTNSSNEQHEIRLSFQSKNSTKIYTIQKSEINLEDTTEVKLEIENIDRHRIELTYDDVDYKLPVEASREFDEHLKKSYNHKVFFSAPFGKGKSTFLDYYFKDKNESYEVFKVFPVNYSVASNQDIFKYIKVDILMQLISKGVNFDKESFSNELLAQQFAISESKAVIKSLIKITFSLNSATAPLNKTIDEIEKIFLDYKNYKAKLKINDFEKAKNYIEKLYEEEGSIFEDNFYTQLIRQLVQQLNEYQDKKTVLIIDDLDRMDPEHIFRILNVISAHCDEFFLDNKTYSNKFGFDKIIIVADIHNIKSVFEHRYGKNADFDGYINKFYSESTFKFDCEKVVHAFSEQIFKKHSGKDHQGSIRLLDIFNQHGLLSIRQVLKIRNNLNFDAQKQLNKPKYRNLTRFCQDYFFHILLALLDVYHTKDNFKNKINILRNTNHKIFYSLQDYCEMLLGSIVANKNPKASEYILNGTKLYFDLESNIDKGYLAKNVTYMDYKLPANLVENNERQKEYNFTKDDFCDLLIKNIELL